MAKKAPKPKPAGNPVSLEAILEIVDWQIDHHEGDDRQVLIQVSDDIYAHIHGDDPEEEAE